MNFSLSEYIVSGYQCDEHTKAYNYLDILIHLAGSTCANHLFTSSVVGSCFTLKYLMSIVMSFSFSLSSNVYVSMVTLDVRSVNAKHDCHFYSTCATARVIIDLAYASLHPFTQVKQQPVKYTRQTDVVQSNVVLTVTTEITTR